MQIKKAAFINAAGRYSKIILSLCCNAVLARILSAEDYGVVAVITVFSTLFSTLADMGFGPAIIQNRDLTEDQIIDIYSFTVYISIGLMIMFSVCSFLIAAFYKDRVYIPLGQLLSISLLFNALNMVPNGLLNRDKKFISVAIRTIVVYIGTSCITIFLAYLGLKYYALAIQAVLSAFFTFLWNYSTTKLKFHIKFDITSVKKVWNYSSYQFAFNIVNYFSRNLDNLLTGKFMGNIALGYYNKAYTLMLYPVNNLTGVVSPVLHPLLADYQNEKQIIYQKYMRIVRLLCCIGLYVAPVCYLAADELILIAFGSKWTASIICFRMLAIAIIPQMINASAGSIFQALGNTKLLFINSCVNSILTVAAILIGVFGGGTIYHLSVCIAIAYILHFLTAFTMLIKWGFCYKLYNFFKELIPEISILILMIVASICYPFHIKGLFLSLLTKSVYLLIVYLFGLLVSREYRLFWSLIKK